MIETITFEGHTFKRSGCPECGGTYTWTPGTPGGTRVDAMVRHMVEAGEFTVGDARQELASDLGILHASTRADLAEWSMWARENGIPETYRRGDDLTPYFG